MAEKPRELEGTIARYREALGTLGVRAEKVHLFGSYKEGNPREGSDIDLVVVSSDLAFQLPRTLQDSENRRGAHIGAH